ncbi:PREDICTED: von Willebrand factor A domain-containing protein 5A [Galeopterus variegatus]|uniref:von Willebrand factor A domain-containing protein 5A n=1 Tax=Galeopterus variegatus TaxID=482537 RepID=A0ABM0SAV1_GALVR|nr:PREDICTED: von Willebrand factor A domain-containing protein 5A [Galeopterus variegatus]
MVHPCGLLTRQEEPVPLKSIAVTLSICEFVAGVSATLNYENEEQVPLEAFFVFPVDEDSAVCSFEAVVDGKRIVAELQDKTKPLEADGALRFLLPAILNPRYQLSGLPEDSCLKMKTPIVPLEDLPYTLSMVATINSQHGIERVQSTCPLSPIEYLGDNKTSVQVSLADGHKFDRDVELLIYHSEVHTPSVAVEMGVPESKPDCLMGDPCAMVSFYPNIPEAQPPITCREFIFLMDRSGSMQSPMSRQDRSQLRIEAAKETLILLLKSLPMGCYFNIYGFGSSYEAFFQESVKYTQHTMEEALRRVQLMEADLGGTEILTPLQNICRGPCIPGHPLQLFVFTDGEVTDTFTVIKEVRIHSQKRSCRCFSFGIGEGASTSLIKGIARASGGTSEFITGKERMQSKALRSLKRSLQPVVEDICLSWDLPPGLSAKKLSPEQNALFRGQRLIVYAQLTGMMLPAEAAGEVCLQYTLQGKSFEDKVMFSVKPKPDSNLTIHRLAAKSLLQAKDMGFRETPASAKKEVLNISLESGVISSYTAFIAINKELNMPVQGPLAFRDIPRPILLGASAVMPIYCSDGEFYLIQIHVSIFQALFSPVFVVTHVGLGIPQACSHRQRKNCMPLKVTLPEMGKTHPLTNRTDLETYHTVFGENHLVQLISLQNANGSWDLNADLAKVLGISLEDMLAALPAELVDSLGWATVLAVIWLHTHGKDLKCEWELLERKAVAWIRIHAGSTLHALVKAANTFLKSSVNPAVFAL